ncbi:hypothetical protein [Streptomyces sp. WAC08241]|uniref:hypothetical protein n=1 Tax=Streptomyces sp. WAC08241 TaxID=2487421 RepID=UPI000F799466|nr:hypothetical protein [Streptomyces sp. WAC08241]RSS35775.1 hypothetical protein EF906_26665 [Streptomyces sp. WAC08241]
MTSHTGAIYTDGPVRRILELAVAVQESAGELSLDDELRRFVRTVKGAGATDWACPLVTVTALLDHVADLCAGDGGDEGTPRDFRELLRRATGGTDPSGYLRTLAGMLRILAQDPASDFEELPMARWEANLRFSALVGFGVNWVYEGEYATLRESIEAAISSEHPFCAEFLAPLASQAQSALVIRPGVHGVANGLAGMIGWATPAALRQVIEAIDAHMRQEHAAP